MYGVLCVCVVCVCVCVNTDVGLTFSLGQFTEETVKELLFLVLSANLYQNNANSSVHTHTRDNTEIETFSSADCSFSISAFFFSSLLFLSPSSLCTLSNSLFSCFSLLSLSLASLLSLFSLSSRSRRSRRALYHHHIHTVTKMKCTSVHWC